jgi:hypothetical protein
LVKSACNIKHRRYISHVANIPIANVLVQYTIVVTPSLGGQHSNVAITVAANTFTDIVGNANTAITKNTHKVNRHF